MTLIKFNHVYVNYLGWAAPVIKTETALTAVQQGYPAGSNPALSLGVKTKRSAALDQDSLSLAVEAVWPVIDNWRSQIQAVYFGSESPPYAVKPAVTLLVNFLGLSRHVFGADLEFACRAGIEAVISAANFVQSHKGAALAIGADVAQAKPGDVLEFTASAGAGAWIISSQAKPDSHRLTAAAAYTSDTPDFWRLEGDHFPLHGGRFTGQPAYFHHLETVYNHLCRLGGYQAKDFAKAAIHAPNLKFPLRLARRLGLTKNQIEPLWVDQGGNPYTASVMIQTAIKAQNLSSGDKLLILSFGSGAGAIALILEKT